MFAERPHDAYAALQYLQAQPFVRADRVGAVGWSQGGATILLTIRTDSSARPAGLKARFPRRDRALSGTVRRAAAGDPDREAAARNWTTAIPLMVLQGAADNWTPAPRCEAFIGWRQGTRRAGRIQALSERASYVRRTEHGAASAARLPAANGVVPLIGTDEAARADALVRVPEFLRRHLKDQ